MARTNTATNVELFGRLNELAAGAALPSDMCLAAQRVLQHVLASDLLWLERLVDAQPSLQSIEAVEYDSLSALWEVRKCVDDRIENLFREGSPFDACRVLAYRAEFASVAAARMFTHQTHHHWKLQAALDRESPSIVLAEDLLRDLSTCLHLV